MKLIQPNINIKIPIAANAIAFIFPTPLLPFGKRQKTVCMSIIDDCQKNVNILTSFIFPIYPLF